MTEEHKYKRLDSNPGAVVNTDRSAAESYRLKKLQNERINSLEKRMSGIEGMLAAILERVSKDD